jgi:hypothetical protein
METKKMQKDRPLTTIKITLAPDTEQILKDFLKAAGVKRYNKDLEYYTNIMFDAIVGDCKTIKAHNMYLVDTMRGAQLIQQGKYSPEMEGLGGY